MKIEEKSWKSMENHEIFDFLQSTNMYKYVRASYLDL